MSEGLDLTAAVEAGARAQWEAMRERNPRYGHLPWEEIIGPRPRAFRAGSAEVLSGAAPLIEAQVREQVAREIEALIEASPASGMFTGTGEYVTQRWVPATELRSFIARGPKP